MRTIKFVIACLVILIVIQSCKPKDESVTKDLFNKGSDTLVKQPEQGDLSPQELLARKWRVTGTIPAPSSAEERDEMMNTTLEFTKEGKLFVTNKGETEEAATIAFSFDNRYLLSQETGNTNNIDSLLIQELSLSRLVLVAIKENRTLIAEPIK